MLFGDNELEEDAVMKSFENIHELNANRISVVSFYSFTIRKSTQFDYVVTLLSAGLSFNRFLRSSDILKTILESLIVCLCPSLSSI